MDHAGVAVANAEGDPQGGGDGIQLPAGYNVATVEAGFPEPVKVVWTPSATWATQGERLIADHTGVVYRTNIATGVRTVLIDLTGHVNVFGDRGLNSVAVDPDYATNHYIYLSYTYENDASKPSSCKTSTLTRFTESAAGASAETTILGKVHGGGTCTLNPNNGEPVGSACPAATTTDCIPSDFWSHSAGDIRFGADKTIYATYGDGASYNAVDAPRAYRAQNLDSLAGKVLHVTKTGAGIATNPWYTNSTTTNRSKIWSRGDRNQFRFQIINGIPVGGNVGWSTTEEVERSVKGGNNGWPCYEGTVKSVEGYATTTECKAMYKANTVVQQPMFTYDHNGQGAAIVGGPIITGTKYPALTGKYLYGDYAQNFMWIAGFDANFNTTSAPEVFASNADGPVDMEMGPDGSLYYVSISTGELRRIDYTPGVTCAANTWKIQYYNNPDREGAPAHETCETTGTPKLSRTYEGGAPTFTPADPAYPTDYFSFTATCNCTFNGGNYNFTATTPDDLITVKVDDAVVIDATNNGNATVALNGTHKVAVDFREDYGWASLNVDWSQPGNQPGIHIAAPLEGQEFTPGNTINYSADVAVDGVGNPLPASAVSWSIQLHHCYTPDNCHVHFIHNSTGLTGNFQMPTPDPAPDTDYISVVLTAVDPTTGQSQTVSVDIYF
jgi:glucose/arabinose dehydrogenase